eukprot:352737_1
MGSKPSHSNYEGKSQKSTGKDITRRILLMGLKSCGKTTIFQQIKEIFTFGTSIPLKERINYINTIRLECIDAIITLVKISNKNQNLTALQSLSIHNENDLQKIAEIMSNIWRKNNKFKHTLSYLYLYNVHLNDNIAYFLDNIKRIMDKDFYECISFEDIIKYQTNDNFTRKCFWSNNANNYEIIDIGSNFDMNTVRNINIVDTIAYVVSLSDYCVYIKHNDKSVNAMLRSLEYFQEICNDKYFKKCKLCVIFNKVDLFRQRLRNGTTLTECFGCKWKGVNYINYEKIQQATYIIVSNWIRVYEKEFPCSIVPNVIETQIIKYSQMRLVDLKRISDLNFSENFNICYKEALNSLNIKVIMFMYIGCKQQTEIIFKDTLIMDITHDHMAMDGYRHVFT